VIFRALEPTVAEKGSQR